MDHAQGGATAQLPAAYLRNAPDVLNAFARVRLSDELEDEEAFTDVAYTADGGALLAAGGAARRTGVYIMRTATIDSVVDETSAMVRGAMTTLRLHALQRYGVRRIGVPKIPGRPEYFLFSGTDPWDHAVRMGVIDHGGVDVQATFAGHRDEVTSIATTHTSSEHYKTFATTADDGCVCVWALEVPNRPLARIRTSMSPKAAYDATGTVIAVTSTAAQVDLYDLRMFSLRGDGVQQPFASFSTGVAVDEPIETLAFEPLARARTRATGLLVAGSHTLSHVETSAGTDTPVGERLTILENGRGAPSRSDADGDQATVGPAVYLPDGNAVLRGTPTGGLRAISTTDGHVISTFAPARTGLPRPPAAFSMCEHYWSLAYVAGRAWHAWTWPYDHYPRVEGGGDEDMRPRPSYG